MQKKILLTATVQSHIAQFHRPLIKILKEAGYEVHVAARNNLAEKNGLQIEHVDKIYDVPFQRSPLHPLNIRAFFKVRRIINEGGYDIISCNTPAGGVYTRLAATKARKNGTRVIYTAHGFHFYKGAPKTSWLIFYPIERALARFTDTLITITKEDYCLAKPNFHTQVEHIYGVGADDKKFLSARREDVEALRSDERYSGRFNILCTGELNENKNQMVLIDAMARLKETHPEAKLLLAGNGPSRPALEEAVEKYGLENNVEFLDYRPDVEKYVELCDLVVSMSLREGMPLNIIEASICKKPIVASFNRGHKELISDRKTGLLVDPHSIDGIVDAITEMIENPALREEMATRANESLRRYWMTNIEDSLRRIYLKK